MARDEVDEIMKKCVFGLSWCRETLSHRTLIAYSMHASIIERAQHSTKPGVDCCQALILLLEWTDVNCKQFSSCSRAEVARNAATGPRSALDASAGHSGGSSCGFSTCSPASFCTRRATIIVELLMPSRGGDVAVIVEKFQPWSLARVLSFLRSRGRKSDIFDDESLKSGSTVSTTVAGRFE